MQVFRKYFLAVIAAVAVFALAACGSDNSSSSTGSASTPAAASTTADTTAAAAAGGAKDPGNRTIGVIPSTSSSENLGVWIAQMKASFEPFGWKVNVCDGAGNPATMERCGQTFVTQKADAIVTLALGGPEIPNTFKQAKAAGIPVIEAGTSANPGYEKIYDGVFADDIPKMGAITGNWIAKNRPNDPVVGLDVTANYGGHGYIIGVKKGLADNGMKYTDLRDTNLADIVNSMKTTSVAVVQKNPGKLTYVTFNDIDSSLYWSDFQKIGRDKDVTMITRYDDPSTVKIMKKFPNNILVNNSKDWQHYFDLATALAAYWVDKTPLPDPATTTNTPGADVYSIKDFPDQNAERQFPFDPALKTQIAEWSKTYKLKPSTLKAP